MAEATTTRKGASTRERLLEAARELFLENGYNATSITDILSEAEAHSGSLYHFFPTKQELLIAVLERYRDGIEEMLLEPAWEGVDDPIERIFALLDSYRRLLVESDFDYACPIGSLALELHRPDPVVRHKIAQNFTAWRHAVERCLADASDRIPADVPQAALAGFVLTTMEGAVMLARTYRDAAAFDAAVARLRDYFERLERDAAVAAA